MEHQDITGSIVLMGQHFFLHPNPGQYCALGKTCGVDKIELQAANTKTQIILQQLLPGDSIRASVVASSTVGILLVESVDFVGLHRLLGRWISHSNFLSHPSSKTFSNSLARRDTAVIEFQDFSNLSIMLSDSQNSFHYAITPKDENSWRFFVTDSTSVRLGEIRVSETALQISFFDSVTGLVNETLHLQKLIPLQVDKSKAGEL